MGKRAVHSYLGKNLRDVRVQTEIEIDPQLQLIKGGGGALLSLVGPGRIELALTAAIALVTVAALGARNPHRVDGWIVVGAFAVQAAFTSWPAHLFLTLALLIYAIDVLAPPLCTQVRRLRTAARNADQGTRASQR